ncbi:hypothetical protein IAI10_05865 [Clostridium sp. 19966]|uniref:hypothetical protein n=1 Tax=Clostridium sp. 19966 TaxID=2768166 RepID=UPI0028DF0305|nr:hypothetical protein [Clostridium sp. 19966]MDT8716175.1 hypothetical protein [Clostridium sp. 19966]
MRKRIFNFIIIVIFISILAGCSSKKASSSSSSSSSKSSSSTSSQNGSTTSSSQIADASSNTQTVSTVATTQEFKDFSQQDKDSAVKLAVDLTNAGIKGDFNMISQNSDMDLAKTYPKNSDLITEYTRQFKISNAKSYTMEVGTNNNASELWGVYAQDKPQGAFNVSVSIIFHVVANDGTQVDSNNIINYFMVKEDNKFVVYAVTNYYNANPNAVFFTSHSIVYNMFDHEK